MRLFTISPSPYSLIKKKKNFLLVEILLSLTLVSLCLVPLVGKPRILLQKTLQSLERLEYERIADLSFVEIREMLFHHKIPWNELPKAGEITKPFPMEKMVLQIPGIPQKKIDRSFVLRCDLDEEKEGLSGEIYRILKADLILNGTKHEKHTTRIFVTLKKKH